MIHLDTNCLIDIQICIIGWSYQNVRPIMACPSIRGI